jgi:hypothetical protein
LATFPPTRTAVVNCMFAPVMFPTSIMSSASATRAST